MDMSDCHPIGKSKTIKDNTNGKLIVCSIYIPNRYEYIYRFSDSYDIIDYDLKNSMEHTLQEFALYAKFHYVAKTNCLFIVCYSLGRKIRVIDIDTEKCIKVFGEQYAGAICFSSRVCAVSYTKINKIIVYDLITYDEITRIDIPARPTVTNHHHLRQNFPS